MKSRHHGAITPPFGGAILPARDMHFATKNNLNIFMKEGTIPHGDGLAAGREHHANQVLVDHDSRLPVEEKKDWRVVKT